MCIISPVVLAIAVILLGNVMVLGQENCTLTPAEWARIKNYTSFRNFVAEFIANGDCDPNNPTGLLGKYRSCTQTLNQIVMTQGLEPDGGSCSSAMSVSLFQTGNPYNSGEIQALATRICSARSFGDTMTDDQVVKGYFCVPVEVFGCPRGADIFKFSSFAGCYMGTFVNKSNEFIDDYFAQQKDIKCLRDNNICTAFAAWKTCPITVNQTLSYLAVDQSYTCTKMFPGHEERCTVPFAVQQDLLCPPLTVLEANIYTIVLSCTLGPLAILLCYLGYRRIYRAEHITDDDVLKQAISPSLALSTGSSPTERSFASTAPHPELQAVLKKSKYKGVKFDQATGSWYVEGMQRMFVNEKEAAQQAYLQNSAYHGPSYHRSEAPKLYPSPAQLNSPGLQVANNPAFNLATPTEDVEEQLGSGVYRPETPEEKLERRKAQLVAFYQYWDAEKQNGVENHVETLFDRHDFKYVYRAVKTKYGLIPPGWDEEAELE